MPTSVAADSVAAGDDIGGSKVYLPVYSKVMRIARQTLTDWGVSDSGTARALPVSGRKARFSFVFLYNRKKQVHLHDSVARGASSVVSVSPSCKERQDFLVPLVYLDRLVTPSPPTLVTLSYRMIR